MYKIEDITNRILCGDTREVLKNIPDNSVDLVFTSPPYFGLRSYGIPPVIWGGKSDCSHEWGDNIIRHLRGDSTNATVGNNKNDYGGRLKSIDHGCFCIKCGAYSGELGHEPDHNLFIAHLLEVFFEIKRVLKDTGSCYVNLGDSYNGSGGCHKAHHKNDSGFQGKSDPLKGGLSLNIKSYPKQSLLFIPTRFAEGMVDKLGFCCHNTIIWNRENCMPFSGKLRFTNSFEYIFFFTKKSSGYNFNQMFEPSKNPKDDIRRSIKSSEYSKDRQGGNSNFNQIHRDIEKVTERALLGRNMRNVWTINTSPNRGIEHYASFPKALAQRVIEAASTAGSIALDPFSGSGTVPLVAKKMGRKYIGIDIKPEYADTSRWRIFRETELDYSV